MRRREFLAFSASLLGASMAADVPAFGDVITPEIGRRLSLLKNVSVREKALNSDLIFRNEKRGRVAFLGGSITEMNGYRPMVCEYLQKKYPETEFDFVAAGIASTTSDVGAFRLKTDVLKNGPVDLFFVEFAVNDDVDGHFDLTHSIRGMEGIIRRMRLENPNVDIFMMFFVDEHKIDLYRKDEISTSIQAHTAVAERYGVTTLNFAKEVQERIDDKKLTWAEFGGVHPADRKELTVRGIPAPAPIPAQVVIPLRQHI
ncbi:MAG: hypothetical protein HUK22_04580, partial [Thermoguttaceae bacterium]|nr:hypothetical protein [Thermoguttaceae bacterium]